MAKKTAAGSQNATAEADQESNQGGTETTAGYFRRVFTENPHLLKKRSNEKVLERWLADHPGHTEVPDPVKASLSNIKSILRSKKRKGGRKRSAEVSGQEGHGFTEAAPVRPRRSGNLETLEEQIDECLTLARALDPEELQNVIALLRRARNEVVWQLGQ